MENKKNVALVFAVDGIRDILTGRIILPGKLFLLPDNSFPVKEFQCKGDLDDRRVDAAAAKFAVYPLVNEKSHAFPTSNKGDYTAFYWVENLKTYRFLESKGKFVTKEELEELHMPKEMKTMIKRFFDVFYVV